VNSDKVPKLSLGTFYILKLAKTEQQLRRCSVLQIAIKVHDFGLAILFHSGTMAGPHTDYVCAWSEHSIALSHVSSVHSQRDCSRRLECMLGHSFKVLCADY
jgi:hypothetical protein